MMGRAKSPIEVRQAGARFDVLATLAKRRSTVVTYAVVPLISGIQAMHIYQYLQMPDASMRWPLQAPTFALVDGRPRFLLEYSPLV